MTTKELMIGDYITFSDVQNDSDCPKLKVAIIDKEDVYVSIDGDPALDLCDTKEFAGIPLTPEILEKNGFKECNKDTDGAIQYELGDESLGVDVWVNTEPCLLGAWRKSYSMINELPISFVHELQHCLNLVGIRKNIEL